MSVYTRSGDNGDTGLMGGLRISKADNRICLLGEIDALNSSIGVLVSHMFFDVETVKALTEDILFLEELQSVLFDIGSEVGNAGMKDEEFQDFSEVIKKLEDSIDRMEKSLKPLTNFILPGGTISASHSHVCRTTARNTERSFVAFTKGNSSNITAQKLLNRVSDYFFVLARYLNCAHGVEDVVWKKLSSKALKVKR